MSGVAASSSDRDRDSSSRSRAVADRPGATFGAQRGAVLSSEASNDEQENDATVADTMRSRPNSDCEPHSENEPQCSRSSKHTGYELQPTLNEESSISSNDDVVWQYCDAEVAVRRAHSQIQRSHDDGESSYCQLPATAQISNSSASIERELEQCKAEIERLSREIAGKLPERQQLVQHLSGARVGQKSARSVKDGVSKSISSHTDPVHSSVIDRPPRLTSLERRRLVRGKASADGRQLAKADLRREAMEKTTVKPVEARQSESKSSTTRKPLRTVQVSDLKDKQFQQQSRARRDKFISQSSDSDAEVNSNSCLTRKQYRQKSSRNVSHRPTRDHTDSRRREIKQSDDNDCLNEYHGESELVNNVCFNYRSRKLQGRNSRRDYSSDSSSEGRRDRCNFRSSRHHSPTTDESEVPRSRRKKSGGCMKPEKFNGTTCFETFLVQFNNCSQFNQWNEREKLQYLRWSLTGTAAQMLWGIEGMSFRQLVIRLRTRFGSLDMEEKYQTEIQCRRRRPEETLRELAQDIRRLMMLAYPGDRSAMAERLAKEHYLCGLDDPELELKVREKEPQDLDSALKAAQRLEVFRGAVRQRSSVRQRVNRQVTEQPDSASGSLEDRVAKIEQSMHGPQRQESSPKRSHQQSSQRASNPPKDRKRNSRQHTCAANVSGDESWKEVILKKVRDL